MPRFENLGGIHHEGAGRQPKVIARGGIFESPHELDIMFPGKFRRVGASEIRPQTDPIRDVATSRKSAATLTSALPAGAETSSKDDSEPAVEIVKKKGKKGAEPTDEARGEDVTGDFDLDAEFKVFKKDKLFHVWLLDGTAPIKGGEGLKEKEVDGAVKAYLNA